MSFNSAYQDGLSGLKRPSNGDQSSFEAGQAARREREFWDMIRRQQEETARRNRKW